MSMLTFEEVLVTRLPTKGVQVETFHPAQKWGGDRSKSSVAKWRGYIDKFLLVRGQLSRLAKNCDLVHIVDQGNAMYAGMVSGKVLVTCHDMLNIRAAKGELPGVGLGKTGRVLQSWIQKGLMRADKIACVSRATQQDTVRLLGRTETDCPLIPNGLFRPLNAPSATEAARIARQKLELRDGFIFQLGSEAFYKNRPGVVRVFAELRRQGYPGLLALGGKPLGAKTQDLIRELGVAEFVVECPNPTDSEIAAYYRLADATLVLSHWEGFGLPILECQQCGGFAVVNDREPMSEIVGEAGLRVDAENPPQAATAILDAMVRKADYTAQSSENLKRYDTDLMIDRYVELYYKMTGGPT